MKKILISLAFLTLYHDTEASMMPEITAEEIQAGIITTARDFFIKIASEEMPKQDETSTNQQIEKAKDIVAKILGKRDQIDFDALLEKAIRGQQKAQEAMIKILNENLIPELAQKTYKKLRDNREHPLFNTVGVKQFQAQLIQEETNENTAKKMLQEVTGREQGVLLATIKQAQNGDINAAIVLKKILDERLMPQMAYILAWNIHLGRLKIDDMNNTDEMNALLSQRDLLRLVELAKHTEPLYARYIDDFKRDLIERRTLERIEKERQEALEKEEEEREKERLARAKEIAAKRAAEENKIDKQIENARRQKQEQKRKMYALKAKEDEERIAAQMAEEASIIRHQKTKNSDIRIQAFEEYEEYQRDYHIGMIFLSETRAKVTRDPDSGVVSIHPDPKGINIMKYSGDNPDIEEAQKIINQEVARRVNAFNAFLEKIAEQEHRSNMETRLIYPQLELAFPIRKAEKNKSLEEKLIRDISNKQDSKDTVISGQYIISHLAFSPVMQRIVSTFWRKPIIHEQIVFASMKHSYFTLLRALLTEETMSMHRLKELLNDKNFGISYDTSVFCEMVPLLTAKAADGDEMSQLLLKWAIETGIIQRDAIPDNLIENKTAASSTTPDTDTEKEAKEEEKE